MSMNNKKILWVEDDIYTLFEPMMHELIKLDIEILTATNYIEAMKHIKDNDINLIILDLLIPWGDKRKLADINTFVGLNILREISKIGILTPVLVFSVVRDKGVIEECKSLGAKSYIEKGYITPKDLKNEVKKHIL